MSVGNNDRAFAAFEIEDLADRRRLSGEPWLPFLEVPTLRAGLYALPVGGIDPQEPHEQDEVYHVLSGKAVLEIEGEDCDVGPGSVVYVKAHAEHRFHSIAEELVVLVFFSKAAIS